MGEHTGTRTGEDGGGPMQQPRVRRRGQGELESQVLALLHRAPAPATAGWVQQHLEGGLAYTTVVTILTRLHAKGTVRRERAGRSYVWLPAADEAGLAALRMRSVLESGANRDAVLASFVSTLSPHDEQVLRDLLHSAGPQADAARPSTSEG